MHIFLGGKDEQVTLGEPSQCSPELETEQAAMAQGSSLSALCFHHALSRTMKNLH